MLELVINKILQLSHITTHVLSIIFDDSQGTDHCHLSSSRSGWDAVAAKDQQYVKNITKGDNTDRQIQSSKFRISTITTLSIE